MRPPDTNARDDMTRSRNPRFWMPLFGQKTGFRAHMNEIKSGIPCSAENSTIASPGKSSEPFSWTYGKPSKIPTGLPSDAKSLDDKFSWTSWSSVLSTFDGSTPFIFSNRCDLARMRLKYAHLRVCISSNSKFSGCIYYNTWLHFKSFLQRMRYQG